MAASGWFVIPTSITEYPTTTFIEHGLGRYDALWVVKIFLVWKRKRPSDERRFQKSRGNSQMRVSAPLRAGALAATAPQQAEPELPHSWTQPCSCRIHHFVLRLLCQHHKYGTASRQIDSSESRNSLRVDTAAQPTMRRRVVALDVATGCAGRGAESVAPGYRDRRIGVRETV